MVISDIQLTVVPTTALYTNDIPDADITASESSTEGRKAIVLDYNGGDGVYARDMGCRFTWPVGKGTGWAHGYETVLYVWQPSLLAQPENVYSRSTDWDDGGYAGAKFVQGYLVEANSFGTGKTFQIQSSDDLSLHTLKECPANFGSAYSGPSEIAFSCEPFISHMVRLVSSDGVPWQVFRSRPIFTPYPELVTLWTTELLNFGLGWQHVRMLNIPYIASSPVTITLSFDQQASIALPNILPATASQLYPTKTKVMPPVNKSKLVGFRMESDSPFRLFREMMEIWVGPWGRSGPYIPARPFGGNSGTGLVVSPEYRAELK